MLGFGGTKSMYGVGYGVMLCCYDRCSGNVEVLLGDCRCTHTSPYGVVHVNTRDQKLKN